MSNHDDTWQHLTVSEAAARLGVSTATIRRMVRAGKLEGDTVLRPQGKTYVVRLPRQVSDRAEHVADTGQMPGGMSRGNVAAQEAMAAWSTSVLTPILAPIVAELTASRLANEQKAETIGRLTSELDAARAQISTLEVRAEAQAAEPIMGPLVPRSSSTTWLTPWRFWIIAVLVLVLIGVGVVQVTVALFSMAAQLTMSG